LPEAKGRLGSIQGNRPRRPRPAPSSTAANWTTRQRLRIVPPPEPCESYLRSARRAKCRDPTKR
jgi:hypothetical protein